MMSEDQDGNKKIPPVKFWYPKAVVYDPLKIGSIDGTTTEPHDNGIIRALNAEYRPNHKVIGVPERTVFVARLSSKTTEKTLKHEFGTYGKIVRCRLVRDVVTNFSKGYAFIEYEFEDDAHRAVKRADQTIIDGKTIFVDYECERLLPGWIPRRLGGGFGGRKESGQLRFGGKGKLFAKPVSLMDKYELKSQLRSKNIDISA